MFRRELSSPWALLLALVMDAMTAHRQRGKAVRDRPAA